jgi:hypothetical protein
MSAIDQMARIRRPLIAAVFIALLPAPVLAQAPKGPATDRSDSEKKKDAEIDKAYRDSLKRNSTAPAAKSDPWQTIRPASADTTKQR